MHGWMDGWARKGFERRRERKKHAQNNSLAPGLRCDREFAREYMSSDDLENVASVVYHA